MKLTRRIVRCQAPKIPEIQAENRVLTSFAGLVVFQQFFANIRLAQRLKQCFGREGRGRVFSAAGVFMQLILHILLGYRQLRESECYRDDPLVKRFLGLRRLPDVATISRMLKEAKATSVENLRALLREMIFDRLGRMNLARLTLDFDGSVQSTGRFAEGTAVGFNKKKKGARSYYPLFCTIAQTGQVLDFHHRPGNVHDSNGAAAFILDCIQTAREALPGVIIEVRMDSAFFSDEIVKALNDSRVEFSISVPFERFTELKNLIENRKRWQRCDGDNLYFELPWKPQRWDRQYRLLFIRTRAKRQQKGPVQLDLFIPYVFGYEFKVVITNKSLTARKVVAYHAGRGSQEGIFAELKSQCQMDYVPVRRLVGNQLYLLASLFVHNLTRDLQMEISPPTRRTTEKRVTLWVFEQIKTLRCTLLCRAGCLTRPRGTLTLTIAGGKAIFTRLLKFLTPLQDAA